MIDWFVCISEKSDDTDSEGDYKHANVGKTTMMGVSHQRRLVYFNQRRKLLFLTAPSMIIRVERATPCFSVNKFFLESQLFYPQTK